MSSLAGKTLLSTYTSLLKLEGDTQALVAGGGTAIQVKTGDNESTPIYLNTDRVGIGTSTPDTLLNIEGTEGTAYAGGSTITDSHGVMLKVANLSGAADSFSGIRFQNHENDLTGNARIVCISKDSDGNSGELAFTVERAGVYKEALRIDEDGNVGIGTASPDTLLHLSGNKTAIIRLESTDTTLQGSDTIGRIEWETQDGTQSGVNCYIEAEGDASDGHGQLRFGTGLAGSATNKVTIDKSGNVGIGTDAPTNLLTIEKAGTVTAATNFIRLTNSGNASSMTNTRSSILFHQYYYDGSSPATEAAAKLTVGTEGNWTSDGVTHDSYMAFHTNLNSTVAEKMRITSAGNVGIGTASPESALHINGTSGAISSKIIIGGDNDTFLTLGMGVPDDNTAYIAVDHTDALAFGEMDDDHDVAFENEWMRITNAGKVGIGTTNPAVRCEIVNTGSATAMTNILRLTNSGNASSMINTRAALQFWQYYYDASTPAAVQSGRIVVGTETNWTSDTATQDAFMTLQTTLNGTITEKMRITSDGNVGIGTTAPTTLLHVNGVDTFGIIQASRYESDGVLASGDDIGQIRFSGSENGTGFDVGALIIAEMAENFVLNSNMGTDLSFWTTLVATSSAAPVRRMTIQDDGKVGINTATPGTTLDVHGIVSIGNDTEVTVASGAITITQSSHQVDTEGDASTDDLDTINGGVSGAILILRGQSSSRDVTLKDVTDNLHMAGDFTLTNTADSIMFYFGGTNWHEISRSNNA